MKLHRNPEMFKKVARDVAVNTGIKLAQVEKDYYVTLVLKELALIKDVAIVFKGGTSLSKCYDVIERFSEDIDLCILYDGEKVGNSRKERLKSEIIGVIDKLNMNLLNESGIFSRRSFNKYLVGYEKHFADSSANMIKHIVIETITTYKPYPTSKRTVNNFISDYLLKTNKLSVIDDYELQPFMMLVQTIERTFIDKVFAICDYHMKGTYSRHSRHIYDLVKIWMSNELDKETVRKIIGEVIEERKKQGHINPSSLSGSRPTELLRQIVENDVYRADYNEITNTILFSKYPYRIAKMAIIEIINSGLIPETIR